MISSEYLIEMIRISAHRIIETQPITASGCKAPLALAARTASLSA